MSPRPRGASPTTKSAGIAHHGRRHWALVLAGTAFVISLVWTVVVGSPLERAREATDELRVVGLALAATGASFVIGLALLATAGGPVLGRTFRRNGGRRPPLRTLLRSLPEIGAEVADHRWFMVGWYLNSAGTLLPCLVLVVAVVAVLPPASWGLAVLPAVDFVVSVAVRLQVDRALRRARASKRVGVVVPGAEAAR